MNCSGQFPLTADISSLENKIPKLDLVSLAEEDGMFESINIAGIIDVSFFQTCALPIYMDTNDLKGLDGCIPLNTVLLPISLQRELGTNLMDWFYRFAKNNVKEYQIPEVRKRQPVAQVISFTTPCSNTKIPGIRFCSKRPLELQTWVFLRYNLSGTQFENFILDFENPNIERECIGFQSDDIVITVGIALSREPSWSYQNKWEGLPYGFSVSGHFISWGKFVSVDSQHDTSLTAKNKMIAACKEMSIKAFSPLYEDVCGAMLNRIGLNPELKPKVITSKSSSLLALDFTSFVKYSEDGGVSVCGKELKYLTFYKIESCLSAYPDIFSFSKGVGKLSTLDPRKITLYHYEEAKEKYVLFEIVVSTNEWTRLEKCIKAEDLKYEGIEKRAAQYL